MADGIRARLTALAAAHPIPDLDASGLRRFGLTTALIVVVLFGFAFPWLLERPLPVWPWVPAGVLALWAIVAPASLRRPYRGWMWVGILLGRVTTPIVMGVLFFGLVAPIALVRRLMRKDPLRRSIDASAPTYRVPSDKPVPGHLEKPF